MSSPLLTAPRRDRPASRGGRVRSPVIDPSRQEVAAGLNERDKRDDGPERPRRSTGYGRLLQQPESTNLIRRSFTYDNEPWGRVLKAPAGGALDYRKQFRVRPGQKVRLSKLDPSDTGKLISEDDGKEDAEHYLKELSRQQASALRRAQTRGPDRLASTGCRRQGRNDQARVQRRQSAGRRRRELQAAHSTRSRA